MSNHKKRQEALMREAKYEEVTSKRDVQIVQRLKQAQVSERIPFDRKAYTYFYSGAKWADEFPADSTKRRYFGRGFIAGMLVWILMEAIYLILEMEGLLW